MPKPRSSQISLEATPYYHCISRCVRRAFLCGVDHVSGESYEHRRGWLEAKLLELPKVFAIDIAAYAIMSNHYHVVLHINTKCGKSWSTAYTDTHLNTSVLLCNITLYLGLNIYTQCQVKPYA